MYLSAAKLFLAEVRRVLRHDGRMIVTVPLLKDDRRHSGNPYHFYEFTQTGLRRLLEQYFETVSLEIIEGAEGSEVSTSATVDTKSHGTDFSRSGLHRC